MIGNGMNLIKKLIERFEGKTVRIVNENCEVSPEGIFRGDVDNTRFMVEYPGRGGKRIKEYLLAMGDFFVFLDEGVVVQRWVQGREIIKYIILSVTE